MIQSYRDKRTQKFAEGQSVRDFMSFERQAYKRLDILEQAYKISDLANLTSNRLEKLKGDRKDQWSIRINDKWRICFVWNEGQEHPCLVEIIDYH
jgi:toxin HigB-1